jgi:hypothetical protein
MKKIIISLVIAGIASILIAKGSFVDNNDGTVKDNSTRLLWQKCSFGQEYLEKKCINKKNTMNYAEQTTWYDAASYCSSLRLGGKSDWRIPAMSELKSLYDTEYNDPSINQNYFPGTQSYFYWSSDMYEGHADIAQTFNFKNYNESFMNKTAKSYHVRCVSSGN